MKLIGHPGCFVYIFILSSLTGNIVQAQITPDNTLPTSTLTINLDNITDIVGGTEIGKNLFHSFAEFSVDKARVVRFINNSTGVENVIGRVTGNSESKILGLIKSGGNSPNFNLFLLNPKGIIFGLNASLDIKGSFVATTADAIQFGDRGFFSATEPNIFPELLTIDPSAFLFNRIAAQRASITVNSKGLMISDDGIILEGLQVFNGRSLLLVGGNINLDGGIINAPDGRVELGGLAEQGTVGLNIESDPLSLSFPDNAMKANVLLTNQAIIDVKYRGRGSLAINARNIEISEGSSLFSGINTNQVLNDGNAGQITLNASETVTMSNYSLIRSRVDEKAIGDSGNISVKAKSLFLINGSQISTLIYGQGNAGDINIDIQGPIVLEGAIAPEGMNPLQVNQINSFVSAGGVGNSGDVSIKARSLSLADDSVIRSATEGTGNGGSIIIEADDFVSLKKSIFTGTQITAAVEAGAVGNGGTINIQARSLSLTDGAALTAYVNSPLPPELGSPVGGKGNAGSIIIEASDSVRISGFKSDGLPSGILAYSGVGAEGKAGDITITTNSFQISDGALVSNFAGTSGSGGTIKIKANTFEALRGGQILSNTLAQGNAGNIFINAADKIDLSGSDPTFTERLVLSEGNVENVGASSGVFANTASGSTGNGGNVFIDSRQVTLSNGARLTVNSEGTGDAGNITVDTRFLIGSGNSDITANSFGSRGGAININADGVVGFSVQDNRLTSSNDITAFSQAGAELNGIVNLNTPEIDPSRGLIRLPELVIDPSTLITQNICRQGTASELNQTGRGGLPPSVNEALSDDATQVDLAEPVPTQNRPNQENKNSNLNSEQIEPAQGWIFNERGEVVLTAYNPNIIEPQRTRVNSAKCPTP